MISLLKCCVTSVSMFNSYYGRTMLIKKKKNHCFGVVSFHLCLRTFEAAEKVGEVACFACQFASDSESFCGGGSSEGLDEMICTYHTEWLVTGKTPKVLLVSYRTEGARRA